MTSWGTRLARRLSAKRRLAAYGATLSRLGARYGIRVGRQTGSANLVADGLHARTDGLPSLALVAGATGVAAGLPWADPVIGLLIAVGRPGERIGTDHPHGALVEEVDVVALGRDVSPFEGITKVGRSGPGRDGLITEGRQPRHTPPHHARACRSAPGTPGPPW